MEVQLCVVRFKFLVINYLVRQDALTSELQKSRATSLWGYETATCNASHDAFSVHEVVGKNYDRITVVAYAYV